MDRKNFLKKGLLGTGMFAASAALGNVIKNDIDELKELEILGFNHIPNTNSSIMANTVLQILSPNSDDAGVWIHQNAWFHLGKFDKNTATEYSFKSKGNGLYVFNLSGDLKINDQLLNARDGFGIWDTDKVSIKAESDSEFLLMEVPMSV